MRLPTRILIVVLSLLLPGLVIAAERTVSGEVFYRERIALPPGTTLYVGLVTLPEGRPVLGAGASIPVGGQVPILFQLAIRSDVEQTASSFGLVAEIRQGETVLFSTSAAVPVDLSSQGPIDVLVTRKPVEPAPAEPVLDKDLVGAIWTATSVGGKPVIGDRPVTLSIAPDLRSNGHAGCNDYFAQASITEAGVEFGTAAATRKACAPEIMDQEGAFFAALGAVKGFEVVSGSMRLLDAAGVPLIGFVRNAE